MHHHSLAGTCLSLLVILVVGIIPSLAGATDSVQRTDHERVSVFDRLKDRLCEDVSREGWAFPRFCASIEPPAPSIGLIAKPATVEAGDAVKLFWSSKRAHECDASGAWSGPRAPWGWEVVHPDVTSTYTLTCMGRNGSATASVVVTVTEGEDPLTDVCPNFDGDQETMPEGYHEENGECVPDEQGPTDACPNLDGVQEAIPDGYHLEGNDCIENSLEPVDVCPNIDGVQEALPTGYHFEDGGDCIEDTVEPIDVCPNLEGTQEEIPAGYHFEDGDCIEHVTEPAVNHVLMSEVYYDVDAAHGSETSGQNEWVELYNPTGNDIDVSGWTIGDATNEAADTLPAGTAIQAGGYLVVTNATNTASFWTIPVDVPVVSLLSSLGSNGLANTGDAVFLKNGGTTVDAMSYGTTVLVFDPATLDVLEGHSLRRKNYDADTDTASDWEDREVPTPGSF